MTNLREMPLAELAGACQDQTAAFRRAERSDDAFCHELLRRAICERDPAAWEAVLVQYRGMVLAWTRQHPTAAAAGEADDYWVNRTFERFWIAIAPARFGHFGSLAALLKYLKLCVHSVVLDEARARGTVVVDSLETLPRGTAAAGESAGAPDVEILADRRLAASDLWHALAREVPDRTEQLVLYLTFVLDLKPREICARYPGRFTTVADVYRIKRNVLDRLRRSEEVRGFLP